MVIARPGRGGKRKLTSDLFEAVKMYKDTVGDIYETTSYKERHTNMRNMIGQVKLEAVVQSMILAKEGCAELTEYINQYKGDLSEVILDYGPTRPYQSYDEMKDELAALQMKTIKSDEDIVRIDELQKEIDDIDEFVYKELHRVPAED